MYYSVNKESDTFVGNIKAKVYKQVFY